MSRKDRIAKAACTTEGINYVIECRTCRENGTKRRYYGESSRSAFQRGIEHNKEIENGVLSHPLVAHFWEDHGGSPQDILMRSSQGI